MAIPAVLILAAAFWIFISLVKYWYYSRMQINYKYKLDDKVLDEILRPPAHLIDKITEMREAREKNFDDDPVRFYEKYRNKKNGKEENDSANEIPTKDGRPMTLFEEMDWQKEKKLKEKKEGKKQPPKYDKSMFEDPLTRLYREVQNEKKKKEAEAMIKSSIPVPNMDGTDTGLKDQ